MAAPHQVRGAAGGSSPGCRWPVYLGVGDGELSATSRFKRGRLGVVLAVELGQQGGDPASW